MTSSLVGSEMCIRDRLFGAARCGAVQCGALWCRGHGSNLHASSTIAPVSYTHLTLPTICSV
eukprot:1316611-Prorocentrum_lima.AAC.1